MPSAAATLLPTSNEKSMATSHTDRCALNRTDQIHSVECQQTRRHPRRTIPFILAAAALSSLALFLVAASTGRGCLFNSPAPSVASLVVQGQDTLGEWIMKERKVAHWAILDNIGPRAGALPGLVIASPSKTHPNYFYTWTRDSALTFSSIFNRFQPNMNATAYNHADVSLESLIREYIHAQGDLQLVSNPSGTFLDGGLGEPKFMVDGSAFTGSWGRPQRDGPPLRAMVVSRYADYLLQRKEEFDAIYINENLYNPKTVMAKGSILKSDLEYTAHNWQFDSFDLWEEICGAHFFTLMASRAALDRGSVLASELSDPGASSFYASQSAAITDRLESFWNADSGFITATLDAHRFGRSGLDSAVVLAFLHTADRGEGAWGLAGERALATLTKYVDSFKGNLYPINHGDGKKEWNGAIAVGRYSEDVYNGDGVSHANPWYLCTFGVSEMIYRIATHFESTGRIPVTPVSLPFWQNVYPSAKSGQTYRAGDGVFEQTLAQLKLWADGFLTIGQEFQGPDGSFTEQFSRIDGTPAGARHLTWSYAAFIEATNSRHVLLSSKSA